MKILMISPEFPPSLSGMGDYTCHLAVHLQKLNPSLTVLSNDSGSAAEENFQGVTILREVKKWDFTAWPRIRNLVQTGSFKIVHIQYLNLTFDNLLFIHFLPLLLRIFCPGVKTVATFHEFAAPWKRAALLPLLLFSHVSIVTNDNHAKKITELYKKLLIPKKAHRIPLAANITPVLEAKNKRSAVREQLGIASGETLLVRFGIIHDISVPEIATVIESVNALVKKGTPVKLLLMGKEEPAAKALLMRTISGLSLENHVILKTNLAPNLISAYLYASDIGLGLYPDGISEKRTAFLSLLAHGLPVIATQRGALPSELIAGENILTVSYDAPAAAWEEMIYKLMNDPALIQKIKAGGDIISAHHQWQRIAENTLVLYLEIAGQR